MDYLERFLGVMEYQPVDQVPNWEAGVWQQTKDLWLAEGLDPALLNWDWFKVSPIWASTPASLSTTTLRCCPLMMKLSWKKMTAP